MDLRPISEGDRSLKVKSRGLATWELLNPPPPPLPPSGYDFDQSMKSINVWRTNGKHARRGTRQLPHRSPRASVTYLPSSSTLSPVNGVSLGLASLTRVRAVQTSLGHPGAVRFALLRRKRRPALVPSTLLWGYVCPGRERKLVA